MYTFNKVFNYQVVKKLEKVLLYKNIVIVMINIMVVIILTKY